MYLIQVSHDTWDEIIIQFSRNPIELFSLKPRKFEELIAELLFREGFDIKLTPETRDGGRDILAFNKSSIGKHLYLVECKKYSPQIPVGVSLVRALYGCVEQERATAGMIVTTSYFSKDALDFREPLKYRLNLKDYEELVRWLNARTAL